MFTSVLVFAVYAIIHRPRLTIFMVILVAIDVSSYWAHAIFEVHWALAIIKNCATIILFWVVTISLLIHILREKRITLSTLYGAISIYLLMGLSWGFLYNLIEIANASAFAFQGMERMTETIREQSFIYYSFVTLTTLGYGDITPVSEVAKTFSWLEAIVGQIYVTVLIAHFVGVHVAQSVKNN